MIEIRYRLEIGNKCIALDDVNKRILLEHNKYTPMDFETAKKVINEIGCQNAIKVFKVEKSYTEIEAPVDMREFT